MSATKRGKQKQQAEVSEEQDFETFVRESLGQLSKGQKQIILDISNLKAKVNESLTRFFNTFNSISNSNASKQCGFGDKIHWFHVEGRPIRVKKVCSMQFKYISLIRIKTVLHTRSIYAHTASCC